MPEPETSGTGGARAGMSAQDSSALRGLHTRLTVAVPLAAGFVVLLSSFVVLWVGYPLLFEHARAPTVQDMERRVTWVFTVGGTFTLVGLVVAIVLAEWLARPLRTLVSRVESARRIVGEHGPAHDPRASANLAQSVLRDVASSITALVHDGYTLRSLEGGVVTLDKGGVVTSLSPVAEQVLGCPASDATGRLLTQVLSEDPANAVFLDSVREALTGTGHASSAEAVVRTRDGRRAHLGYTITPLYNETHEKLGLVLTFKDLAERKVTEQLVRRAENLAILGSMAFRLAHEIGNPLTAMSGLVELIRDGSPPDSPHREYCKAMLESIERLKRISQELLTIGHPEPASVEPVDINELVHNTLELCRHDPVTQGIAIRENYAADLPRVPGDRSCLAEVVLNILRNACQAVQPGGGEVTLATGCSGERVEVAVKNTGPPIPTDIQNRLFTTFFTTKRGETGLGLAMSQQLVKAHGGCILVDSAPERGTTFTIQLPIAGPAPEGEEGAPAGGQD